MRRVIGVLAVAFSLLAPAQALACYGAEAMGMGGAYTSLARGVLAIYWNQAGLAFTDGLGEASLTVTTPEDSTNYNSFMGVAVKVEDRLGVGFGRTSLAPWAGDERWNTFGAGYRVAENFAVGGALRTLEGKDPQSGLSYDSTGIDFSALYRAKPAQGVGVNLGLLVQDVGGPNRTDLYWQNIRPAISMETDRLTIGFDVYDLGELPKKLDGEPNLMSHQVGLEYRPLGKRGNLALRTGIYQDLVTYGGGVKVQNLFVDLMMIPEWDVVQVTGGIRF